MLFRSIGNVIKSMQTGADAAVMFDDLKNDLSAPIAGMSISFTSSLFGLAGSLILGFLDLQAGQAQNRFYNELEDLLSASASDLSLMGQDSGSMNVLLERILAGQAPADPEASRNAVVAMANLAEGIQGLVQHMRKEQQLIRDWVEAQAQQQTEIKKLLELLNNKSGPR